MNNVKLGKLWDTLHSSYWFLPTLMAIGSVGLAFLMLWIDRAGIKALEEISWLYTGGPNGARGLLSSVAGSMVTVTTTAFSITIVALQLASSNFGPRMLRNFMQDTGNQIVLGTFVSTFIYSLLILRTIHGEEYELFVPQLSVTVGVVLAITSIGVLIYFIHHAATIIQASHVIAEVSNDLHDTIDRLFPDKLGYGLPEQRRPVSEIPADFETQAAGVKALSMGYLQAIDDDELMSIAQANDLLIRVLQRPSQFVIVGSELVKAYPQERVSPQVQQQINDAFVLGRERTEQQDIEFPINQLVEIAMRALSPGINDPFTAIRCIDRLNAALCRLAQRELPSPYRYDKYQNLRVIAEPVTFEMLVNDSFNQIRHYGKSDAVVTIRLLEAIASIARFTQNAKQRAALQRQADMIWRGSKDGIAEELDRSEIEERYHAAIQALRQS